MLFYNHKQEFIGIDDEGLKLLNYTSLEDLLGVCSDAADLFAKEPGYIHNFKSFGWIDFLLHADSDARSAIVHGNGRTFSCTLEVHQLYLCENPSQNGYMIDMTHIQSISGDEIKPHIIPSPKVPKEPELRVEPVSPKVAEISASVLPNYEDIKPTQLSEPTTFDIPDYGPGDFDTFREPLEETITPFTPAEPESLEEVIQKTEPIQPAPSVDATRYSAAEQEFIKNLKTDRNYRFDPNVAANELGLPVDLIEEFIGDFIQQSYDFKSDLFEAALKGDMNNLKILSHKLKGVAANLRIEDAFETLSTVNTSNDPVEIEANLKCFYSIIEKLEGKESPAPAEEPLILEPKNYDVTSEPITVETPSAYAEEDDIYAFAFKQNTDETLNMNEETENYTFPDIVEEESFRYDEPFGEISIEEAESPLESLTSELHYDRNTIAGSLGIEPAFLNELIDDYKHDALSAGQQITDAVAAFDTHLWKKTATQLKGITDHLRLSEISNELAILSETNDAQEAHKASKRLNGYLEQL